MFYSKLLEVNRNELKSELNDAKRRNDNATLSHDSSLDAIKAGLENANRNIEAGNSVLGKLSETVKLEWLRNLGRELMELMRSAMMINFATYRAVIRLQNTLPSHLDRSLIEDPMILEDPIGRIAPVHLQFITSWDAFHSVLEIRFQNMPEYSILKQRRYELQAGGTGREIQLSCPWQHAFLPGQRVEMSFIFADRSSGNTCPGCHTSSEHSVGADMRCSTCGISFRRIQEVQDISNPGGIVAPQHNPRSISGKSLEAYGDGFTDDDDVAHFKRVRLVKPPAIVEEVFASEDHPTAPFHSRSPQWKKKRRLENLEFARQYL
jgi:hypothetical protein